MATNGEQYVSTILSVLGVISPVSWWLYWIERKRSKKIYAHNPSSYLEMVKSQIRDANQSLTMYVRHFWKESREYQDIKAINDIIIDLVNNRDIEVNILCLCETDNLSAAEYMYSKVKPEKLAKLSIRYVDYSNSLQFSAHIIDGSRMIIGFHDRTNSNDTVESMLNKKILADAVNIKSSLITGVFYDQILKKRIERSLSYEDFKKQQQDVEG